MVLRSGIGRLCEGVVIVMPAIWTVSARTGYVDEKVFALLCNCCLYVGEMNETRAAFNANK